MLLLLLDTADDKGTLKEIVQNTFKGLDILSGNKGKKNNFLQKIDEIPLYLEKSERYSNIFVHAIKETASFQNRIISAIDKLDLIRLKEIGLTDFSLNLKVQLYKEKIKKLWAYVRYYANFGLSNVVNLFIDCIDDLLNILESIKSLVPIIDPLIEILKALASLLKQL